MFGFLNVSKPVGMTSFAVIAKLRKILEIKKIGHAGTLDPFAEGVLPIAIGKATRLLDFLSDEKAYISTIQFGFDTDTYDLDGEIIKKYDKKITKAEIAKILPNFRGEINQIPPKYSAIKINGKKLCDLARKGEQISQITPRKVKIKQIEILDFNEEKQELKIDVKCSKGTYIRSLAYDIGQKLNCGAHLTRLIRTNSSGFLLENAIKLDDISKNINPENPLNYLDFPTFEIKFEELKKIKNGNSIKIESKNLNNLILLYEKKIIAIGSVDNSTFIVKKVFYEEN